MAEIKFRKYHGLGNDYLVIEPGQLPGPLDAQRIRRICDRHFGAGSDGILLGPSPSQQADFRLWIYNPDGSEAEKSGNGLRIFSRFLWDTGRAPQSPEWFSVQTSGGLVRCQVQPGGASVTVEMGVVSFDSQDIPVSGARRQVLSEQMDIGGQRLTFCAASLGNPHCVVLRDSVSEAEARHLGPLIENSLLFPRRTNVQFMQVLDAENIRIEIWERGAGYTLASGSSSCAAAAVAHRLGLCNSHITVHVPGGELRVCISPGWEATLSGAVAYVFSGQIPWGDPV